MVVDDASEEALSGRGWRLGGGQGSRVLVVADEPDAVELLSEAFEEEGLCDVGSMIGLSNCLEAFGGGAVRRPDLVVLDTKAPDAVLTRTLERLKQDALATVPIIVLSDLDDRERVQECYGANAAAYLVKPTSPEGVRETARSIAEFWLARTELPEDPVD